MFTKPERPSFKIVSGFVSVFGTKSPHDLGRWAESMSPADLDVIDPFCRGSAAIRSRSTQERQDQRSNVKIDGRG
jgi:hypothetical protein